MNSNLPEYKIRVCDRFGGRTDTGKKLPSSRRISWILKGRVGILRTKFEYSRGWLLSDGSSLRDPHNLLKGSLVDLRYNKNQRHLPRAVYYEDIFTAQRALGHALINGLIERSALEEMIVKMDTIFVTLRKGLTYEMRRPLGIELSRILDKIPERVRDLHMLQAKKRIESCIYWPLGSQKAAFLKVVDKSGRKNPGMFFLKMPAVLRWLGRRKQKIKLVRANFESRLMALSYRVGQINTLSSDLLHMILPCKDCDRHHRRKGSADLVVSRELENLQKTSQDCANLAIRPYRKNMVTISRGLDQIVKLARENPNLYTSRGFEEFCRGRDLVRPLFANILMSELAALLWLVSKWEQLVYLPSQRELDWLYQSLHELRERTKEMKASGLRAPYVYTINFGVRMLLDLFAGPFNDFGQVCEQIMIPVHSGLVALMDLLSDKKEVLYFDQELPF